MLETTHVLTALALAKNIQNPFLAFGAGFISHLVLDAIPHWDGQGLLVKKTNPSANEEFGKKEFTKTGKIIIYSDVFVSFLIFIYLSIFGPLWPNFPNLNSLFINLYSHLPWVMGVLGGIFPDILTLICLKTGFCRPRWFFKLHKKLQLASLKTTNTFDVSPKINAVFGLAFQVILVLFSIYVFVK